MTKILLGLLVAIGVLIPNISQAVTNPQNNSITFSVTVSASGGTTGNIRFLGSAFPGATVTFLQNGAVAGTVAAASDSTFDKTLTGISAGTYTFGLYAQDGSGRKTVTISFDVAIIVGSTITVSGILLSPILVVPDALKRTEPLPLSGTARSNSTVTTFTHSNDITRSTSTDSVGSWSLLIRDVLHLGGHTSSALVQDSLGNQSVQTGDLPFRVLISADLNNDTRVNLTDFSILMFSYAQSPPPNLLADINDNGPSDLVDFSIMMFYWTR